MLGGWTYTWTNASIKEKVGLSAGEGEAYRRRIYGGMGGL